MGVLPVPARTKFPFGFSATVDKVLEYDAAGRRRIEVEPLVGVKGKQLSIAVRMYLTAQGKTPDSGHMEIKNKAIELVKMLDAEEISLHHANEILVETILRVTGKSKTTYRRGKTTANPDQQLEGYKRAVANLEGIVYALDKMPDTVHGSIPKEQRQELVNRLADCRRIIERRINIFRKDENAEADH